MLLLLLLLLLLLILSVCVTHTLHVNSYRCSKSLFRASRLWSSSVEHGNASPIADEVTGWSSEFYETFLAKYWQKKPLFIRKAFPDIKGLVQFDKNDLFALAQDDDVECRLIEKTGTNKWEKTYGPFEKEELDELLESDWTILVQELDRHLPKFADLWAKGFDFVPSWRRDDIMLSYSMPGGGIGAHVDNYDVFLLQGSGSREWAIENNFINDREEKQREVPNMDTRLLRGFQADQAWKMEPGDMLYLPPRIPHRGTTLPGEPCTTISVGFRSPNYQYLVTAFWDYVTRSSLNSDNSYYTDGDLKLGTSPGRIDGAASAHIVEDIRQKLVSKLDNEQQFNRWLGEYLTMSLRIRERPPLPFFLSSDPGPTAEDSGTEDNEEGPAVPADVDEGAGDDHDSTCTDEEDLEDDDFETEIPYSVRGPYSVASQQKFASVEELMSLVLRSDFDLRRMEGVKMAYWDGVMFIDGESYDLPDDAEGAMAGKLGALLCDNQVISGGMLGAFISRDEKTSAVIRFVSSILRSGFFYPIDHVDKAGTS